MQELLAGIWRWEVEDEEGISMSSYAFVSSAGTLVVDPAWDAAAIARLERAPGPSLIVLSTQNHLRDARRVQDRLAAPIAASARTARDLEGVNRTLAPDEEIVGGWRVVAAPGVYSGEIALYQPELAGGTLYVGDLFVTQAAEGAAGLVAALLPERLRSDPGRLQETLGRLTDLAFETVLTGHGPPILAGGRHRVRALALGR
jgi:glyoxylase-like metal-dependent hydrolase (beta-lactamase superfamily II)